MGPGGHGGRGGAFLDDRAGGRGRRFGVVGADAHGDGRAVRGVLQRIRHQVAEHLLAQPLFYLACAAFALLNNGGWQEFVAVGIAAGALGEEARILPVTLDEAYALQEAHQGFAWIGLYRPSDKELASVATEFDLHPLAIEDATGGHQRSKVERYGDTLFVVLRPARYDDAREQQPEWSPEEAAADHSPEPKQSQSATHP